jgi:hypothetical protein
MTKCRDQSVDKMYYFISFTMTDCSLVLGVDQNFDWNGRSGQPQVNFSTLDELFST